MLYFTKSLTLSSGTWLDRALMLAVVLTCAVAISPGMADPDLWGHVQYGRDALRDGLPVTTTHSFTARNYPWINHENIAELLLALGADCIGPVGLLLAKCLLGLGVIGLMLWNGNRQQCALFSRCVAVLLVAVNLSYFWTLRPQVLSFVWYALLLALTSWCFAGWEGYCRIPALARFQSMGEAIPPWSYSERRLRLLWLGPIIFIFWTNSHGGFVAGWCIWTAYLCGRSWEAWCWKGFAAKWLILRFFLLIFAAALATAVNPYGLELHRWLLADLAPPRPEILEWRSPQMLSSVMLPFWLILVTWIAVLLLSRRSRDVTHLMILSLTLWQAFLHQRHLPFFALAFGFWMIVHVDSVLRRFHIVKEDDSQSLPDFRGFSRWALVGILALAFLLLGGKLYSRLSQLTVDRHEYPVSAIQFIKEHQPRGHLVVTFNWAQYALDVLGAEQLGEERVRVSFDGRYRTSYSQDIADMNFDFVLGQLEPRYRAPESRPFDDERVLSFGNPDMVLVNRFQPHSVNVMFRNREGWSLLYQDQISQLWGRATLFDDPCRPTWIPLHERRISEAPQVGMVSWPAQPEA